MLRPSQARETFAGGSWYGRPHNVLGRDPRRVTIAQIAQQTGLSAATVSKVLNGKPRRVCPNPHAGAGRPCELRLPQTGQR